MPFTVIWVYGSLRMDQTEQKPGEQMAEEVRAAAASHTSLAGRLRNYFLTVSLSPARCSSRST